MGEWYGKRILNKVINPKTGKAWVIDDVPKLWKPRTIEWLEQHGEEGK